MGTDDLKAYLKLLLGGLPEPSPNNTCSLPLGQVLVAQGLHRKARRNLESSYEKDGEELEAQQLRAHTAFAKDLSLIPSALNSP